MIRRLIVGFMALVFLINIGSMLALVSGAVPVTLAQTTPDQADPDEAEDSPPYEESLRLLGAQMAERKADLDRRQAELEEALRSPEVLRQIENIDAQTANDEAPPEAVPAQATPQVQPAAPAASGKDNAFLRLQRAYENMEPESAAVTLSALADRDEGVVVELLLGWRPKIAGAILDALSQINPVLAADLSYEIWKRSPHVAD